MVHFGELWENPPLLEKEISSRRQEIERIKNHWKSKLEQAEDPLCVKEAKALLKTGTLTKADLGCGGAYILASEEGTPQFVVKPFDEDILCLHNSKNFASPFNNETYRVRRSIPLYRSMQAEALAYRFAQILGFDTLTPETHLAIVDHPAFFDIADRCHETANLGKPNREKLCSIQRYVPHEGNLYELVCDWLLCGMTEDEIHRAVDLEAFENLFLLIWLLYDTDAHAGNIYVTKGTKEKIFLCKFDNGLTFPENNERLLNSLYFFPQAIEPPSFRLRKQIEQIPIEKLKESILFFEMEGAMDAFLERTKTLQTLAKDPTRSFREIELRMRALELPDGQQIAHSAISPKQLHNLISLQ